VAVQTEWLEKDYYEVLGVPEAASEKDIQRAYRRLARKHHPDANPDDPQAEERFKEISAAYDVVGDADKRKEYDELRRLGPTAAAGASGGFGGGGTGFGGVRVEDLSGFTDLGDLFGDLLGGRDRNGRQTSTGARGRDLETDLQLSFEQAVKGLTTEIHLSSEAPCATCGASGARPGTAPTSCATCGGRGSVSESQGFFSMSQPCPRCGGRGQVVTDPCPDCSGRGTTPKARRVKVRIPAGVADGQMVRLPGRGEPGRHGGPAGDLFVRVGVGSHPLFGRKGANLTVTVPVTYPEAVLGAEIKVPTLDGAPVTVRVPAGTPSGRTLRVKGHGASGPGGGRGDLLVTVEIDVPVDPSPAEREAIEGLAKALRSNPRAHVEV
jgi:molecular chaperone DnaJ